MTKQAHDHGSLFEATELLEQVESSPRRLQPYGDYKPSGMRWLLQVPSHWDVLKLKYITDIRTSNVDKKSRDDEDGVLLCNYVDVYHRDYINDTIDFMRATASKEQINRFTLCGGDVLITKDSETWDDIAVPAYVESDMPGVLCGYHLALIRARPEVALGEYLFRAFDTHAIRDQFRVRANGVTRYGLPRDGVTSALFPVPPVTEQHAIAAFLRREARKIDSLVGGLAADVSGDGLMARQARFLHEYRSCLVSAAVTGQIDVRGEVADGP